MWTADNRPRYNRDKLRYPSDLTDAEWAHIEPLIPPGKPGGGKRRVAIREVINGVMYILSTGCQWRALPKDLPPRAPCNRPVELGRHAGQPMCSTRCGGEASPTAWTGRSHRQPRLRCRQGHVLVDTRVHGIVTAADVQDRDGGLALLAPVPASGPVFHRALAA